MRLSLAELRAREEAGRAMLRACTACAHMCKVDRTRGDKGPCVLDDGLYLAGYGKHFGEEPALVGARGSGVVLLGGCNLVCAYCETADISIERRGVRRVSAEEMAAVFLELERRGTANLNLVTPTHQAPQLVSALRIAAEKGFTLPVVWNCGGYESLDQLRLVDGIVDVYLPDAKYAADAVAEELSGAPGYFAVLKECLREMHRQVGDLVVDGDGLARRGLLVRHLVLPGGLAGTAEVMRALAQISPATAVNVMPQYLPAFRARGHPLLGRRPTPEEMDAALAAARAAGLTRVMRGGLPVSG